MAVIAVAPVAAAAVVGRDSQTARTDVRTRANGAPDMRARAMIGTRLQQDNSPG